ncbi:hypothetical protein [Mucilaginibacter sp.]|uniref:hypothetical protein n=1 Tax=Mucilaginibacter sp. TaxID=1882438 RepID=UPI003B00A6E3
MKKTIIVALLLIGGIGVALSTIVDLTGNWTGVLNSPDGNTSQLDYTFKADGTRLTGTFESVYGKGMIENGKVTDKEITFTVNLNGLDLPHKGTVFTDSISLDIDYKGSPLHVNLKRKVK